MIDKAKLDADLFFLTESNRSFASAQIKLLQAIGESGSISSAAKIVGISYKTAWDRINAMNNMSEEPLVIRTTGGSHGGGTELTSLGQKVIEGFLAIQEEHQAFIQRLGNTLHSLDDLANFIRGESMKTSARNQYLGRVAVIKPGSVNSEVILDIGNSQKIVAIITNESLESLQLAAGATASALIKASWVLLSKDIDLKTSARNQLTGEVTQITEGAVNSDITLDLGGGKSLSAIITNTSLKELQIATGDQACALFKASSVILMNG